MLLNHSGGWDRTVSGNPTGFSRRVERALGVRPPVEAPALIRFMLGEPLDFDPGTRQVYSNFGYVLLGRIIEEVTGMSYAEHVQRATLHPMGIRSMRINPVRGYLPDEARRYNPGEAEPLMPVRPPMANAAGGWLASCVDMARFMTAVDGSRRRPFLSDAMMSEMLAEPRPPLRPRENGTFFGLGWDVVRPTDHGTLYGKDGGLPGVASWIEHLPEGVDFVVLFNAHSAPHHEGPDVVQLARAQITRAIRDVEEWPDGDLFDAFP